MHLFHYTSAAHLRGISRYGLTVGDVVTDLDWFEGQIAVCLTSSPRPEGTDCMEASWARQRLRLEVSIPDDDRLHRCSDWAASKISRETQRRLIMADGGAAASWYLYFGRVPSENIVNVVSTRTGEGIENWGEYWPEDQSVRGVPYDMRWAWQKRTLKQVRKAAASIVSNR